VYWNLGISYALNGEHSKAIATLQRALGRASSDSTRAGTHRALAFAYSEAGRIREAHQHMASLLKLNPRYSPQYVGKITFYKDAAHLERVLAALRKAGMPEN
jgi:tetratricopeptide (TPR) repeat protein